MSTPAIRRVLWVPVAAGFVLTAVPAGFAGLASAQPQCPPGTTSVQCPAEPTVLPPPSLVPPSTRVPPPTTAPPRLVAPTTTPPTRVPPPTTTPPTRVPPPTTTPPTSPPPVTTVTVPPPVTTVPPPVTTVPPPVTTVTVPPPLTPPPPPVTTVPPPTLQPPPPVVPLPPAAGLELSASAIGPGGDVTATGRGCLPDATVDLSIGETAVGHTVAGSEGDFDAPLRTGAVQLGRHEVTAECGRTLTAPLDIVLVSRVGTATSTLTLILLFLVLGLWFYGHRLVSHLPSRRNHGEPDAD